MLDYLDPACYVKRFYPPCWVVLFKSTIVKKILYCLNYYICSYSYIIIIIIIIIIINIIHLFITAGQIQNETKIKTSLRAICFRCPSSLRICPCFNFSFVFFNLASGYENMNNLFYFFLCCALSPSLHKNQ